MVAVRSARHSRRTPRLLALCSVVLIAVLAVPPYSTAKPSIQPAPAGPQPSSAPTQGAAADSFAPVVTLIPSADGRDLSISAAGLDPLAGTVVANVDTGPGSNKGGYTMTYSQTARAYLATAVGFAPDKDIAGSLSITTTGGLKTDDLQYQRAFVQLAQPETVVVDGGAFSLAMPNQGTFTVDTYLAVVATSAVPGPPPPGATFVGRAYGLNACCSFTHSEKLLTIKFGYGDRLQIGVDPHTLAVGGWNKSTLAWEEFDAELFTGEQQLTFVTKQLLIYGLIATTTWRDSFAEATLSGVAERQATQRSASKAIVLANGASTGSVSSIPIRPSVGATGWGVVRFNTSLPPGSALQVDLLDANGELVRAAVASGADLSDLALARYHQLKLRATLTASQSGQTPQLLDWQLGWVAGGPQQVYLPVVVKP